MYVTTFTGEFAAQKRGFEFDNYFTWLPTFWNDSLYAATWHMHVEGVYSVTQSKVKLEVIVVCEDSFGTGCEHFQ